MVDETGRPGTDPVSPPDVAGLSVRELLVELIRLQDQLTQVSARAGYSAPPPPHPFELVPDPGSGPSQDDLTEQASPNSADNRDAPDGPSILGVRDHGGMLEALDLLEALEQRERAVLAELHRRSRPAAPPLLPTP